MELENIGVLEYWSNGNLGFYPISGFQALPGDPIDSRAMPESTEAEPPGNSFTGKAWELD
jgi:hypothetical protein